MYGKTLEDFPEKFPAFLSALESLTETGINDGFQMALTKLTEFPVPAQIIEFSEIVARSIHQKRLDSKANELRLLESQTKGDSFDAEQRRRDVEELNAKMAARIWTVK